MKYFRLGACAALFASGCSQSASSTSTAGTAAASKVQAVALSPEQIAAREAARARKALRQKQLLEARREREMLEIPAWAKGQVLRSVPVEAGDKVFALTFDDGPWPGHTRRILRTLKEFNAKATFYVVGQMARAHPDILREIHAAGHSIGNHSWSHPARPKNPKSEVDRTDAAVKATIGMECTSFRPPYGIIASMARRAQSKGQPVLIWSADSGDWSRPGSHRIASRILHQATPGGVGLLHDGGGDGDQTADALPIILSGLQARGYKLVTVPELLRHRCVATKKAARKSKKA